MNNVTTIGIDLAKSSFSVHGVDAAGAVVLRKTGSRTRVLRLLVEQPPCFGMEACSGAHEWARRLQQFGYRVRLWHRVSLQYRKRSTTCVGCLPNSVLCSGVSSEISGLPASAGHGRARDTHVPRNLGHLLLAAVFPSHGPLPRTLVVRCFPRHSRLRACGSNRAARFGHHASIRDDARRSRDSR